MPLTEKPPAVKLLYQAKSGVGTSFDVLSGTLRIGGIRKGPCRLLLIVRRQGEPSFELRFNAAYPSDATAVK